MTTANLFLGVKIPSMNSMNSLIRIPLKYNIFFQLVYLMRNRLKLFILFRTCGNGKKQYAPPSRKSAPHAFKTFDIELFHIELLLKSFTMVHKKYQLLRVLSLLNLGQFRAVLGADNV